MKKAVIVFIIVVFGVCAFFGFKTASKILPDLNSPSIELSTSQEVNLPIQQNYLLIHVKDSTSKGTELVSMWLALIFPSKPTHIIFMPLLPSSNTEIQARLKKGFTVDSNGVISEKFLSLVDNSFEINTSGFILTDDVGVGLSRIWLTGEDDLENSDSLSTKAGTIDQALSEQASFKQFCQMVTTGTVDTFFSSIDWTQLLPDHFSTNLDFETIALFTNNVAQTTEPIKCEVLSNE